MALVLSVIVAGKSINFRFESPAPVEQHNITFDQLMVDAIEDVANDPDEIWENQEKLTELLRDLILRGAEQKFNELYNEKHPDLFSESHG